MRARYVNCSELSGLTVVLTDDVKSAFVLVDSVWLKNHIFEGNCILKADLRFERCQKELILLQNKALTLVDVSES